MKNYRHLFVPLVMSLLLLTACGGGTDTEPSENGEAPTPAETTPPTTPSPSPTPEASTEDDEATAGNTYKAPDDAFEISFPEGYAKQPRANGLTFVSSDSGFGGEVIYFEAEEELSENELEELFKDRYNSALDEVTWQNSELQPDGSVRIDWRGRNVEGEDLDAVSYIEQHGQTIYILNIYGINEAYDVYLEDANIIVGSYKVKTN
ncbi:MAG: hypothetical protein J7642_23865 [Cyanobacteria bacterium SBC]|nr:hypothetical protein [Cyanobacteria bacterium SBC]